MVTIENLKKLRCLLLIFAFWASIILFGAGAYNCTAFNGENSHFINAISILHESTIPNSSIQKIESTQPTPPINNLTFPAIFFTPQPTNTQESIPIPTPTPTPPPTPQPTSQPQPNTAIMDLLAQLDITSIAKLILVVLAIVWVIIIAVSSDQNFTKQKHKKTQSAKSKKLAETSERHLKNALVLLNLYVFDYGIENNQALWCYIPVKVKSID